MSWVPLESNPEVMNKYLENLGVPTKWQMMDVYGLDADLLATVPRPVLALLLLFPINDGYTQFCKEQDAEIKSKGQTVSDKIFYVKQKISNACGTMALIHSVANNTDQITLGDGALKKFIEESAGMDAVGRGDLLLKADAIANIHKELALTGQSEAPDATQPVNFHFVALVHVDGGLYELDGSKSFPINHGDTTPETFLEDAAVVCRKYMERDPENVNFTIVALAANN
ncbi:ubiquitin carboxyl-terminal hydrolase isozyme L3 [Neocloeon triangulifer]|uniref:ubiquitin carboxyl-terminal hydrolase isozyme L3 n=1 Tax=Neocloeon triangulifer TaxID=2078957 RepID=UPI00286EE95E|nr:ubiquitin carboxyl-terminal hydrolase isozyme L3 [Neocloeon triangulifer]